MEPGAWPSWYDTVTLFPPDWLMSLTFELRRMVLFSNWAKALGRWSKPPVTSKYLEKKIVVAITEEAWKMWWRWFNMTNMLQRWTRLLTLLSLSYWNGPISNSHSLTQSGHWCPTAWTTSPAVICRRGCFHSECPQSSSRLLGSSWPPSPDIPVRCHTIFFVTIALSYISGKKVGGNFYLDCIWVIFIQRGSTAKGLEVVPYLRTVHSVGWKTAPGTQSSKLFRESCTNLPQSVAKQRGSWLSFFSLSDIVAEHVWVVFYCSRFLKHSIHVVVTVIFVLDEIVDRKL